MSTITLTFLFVKQSAAVVLAQPGPANPSESTDNPTVTMVLLVVIIMAIGTVKLLARAFGGPVAELLRMAVSALAALLLLAALIAMLVLALVLSTR